MLGILFVEDNLQLVEELVGLLLEERRDMDEPTFAIDIATGLDAMKINGNVFDVVVLDVMLPAWPDVPAQDEGIYLAAWILGKTGKLPASLQKQERPDWLDRKPPKVIFLTSRTSVPIRKTWKKLTGEECELPIIERMQGDAYSHCREILRHIEGATHGGART